MYLIGFSGKKQAGKDTGAHFLKKYYLNQDLGLIRILSIAEPLKCFCYKWFNLKLQNVYGTDKEKAAPTQHLWENLPSYISKDRKGPMSGREILQVWGSDILREFWPGIHCHQLVNSIKSTKSDNYNLAVVTDVRFPDEVDTILSLGGVIIRLLRAPFPEDNHQSEKALDKMDWENRQNCYVLDNRQYSLNDYETQLIKLYNKLCPL